MEADWESGFLTTRHAHNKNSTQARQSGSKGSSEFDVRRTYGSYELKCSAAEAAASFGLAEMRGQQRRRRNKRKQLSGPRLEIYRLTDDEDGLVGELFPAVLEATVILAGSRRQLHDINTKRVGLDEEYLGKEVTSDPLKDKPEKDKNAEEVDSSQVDRPPGMDIEPPEETAEPADGEAKQRRRFETFEKNSFRQPKFWLWWHGRVLAQPAKASCPETDAQKDEAQTGMGCDGQCLIRHQYRQCPF
ncbi:hypothetical protein B0T10DRAFT_467498 [Thelonectria olida]|uniref:Uncharacterized protein n=1 Tax=Thelonectria olida TaxID=1576542 RepID=A0A9P8VMN7_9HYPO|nr:hypothetical protein B0T10DRAFT_467498 [Thelonectria olida]